MAQFAKEDNEAWKIAAATRKYRLHGGHVYSGGGGLLFALPPLPGFATLDPSLHALVFASVAQFVTNRVGQTAEGDVSAAVAKAITEGTIPGANSNDAFEKHYLSTVADRVNATKPLPEKATSEQKAAQDHLILATAIKNRGGEGKEDGKFAEFRDAGIAAAKSKPVTEKKRQAKKAVDTSAAITL
jgi:hypothetical protein